MKPLCDVSMSPNDRIDCHDVVPEDTQPSDITPNEYELRSEYADDPEMAEILGLFLDELPGRIAAMAQACAGAQLDELGRLAHQIKGSGGSYGFPQLTEAAATLEIAARRGDRAGAGAALDALLVLDRRIAQGR